MESRVVLVKAIQTGNSRKEKKSPKHHNMGKGAAIWEKIIFFQGQREESCKGGKANLAVAGGSKTAVFYPRTGWGEMKAPFGRLCSSYVFWERRGGGSEVFFFQKS